MLLYPILLTDNNSIDFIFSMWPLLGYSYCNTMLLCVFLISVVAAGNLMMDLLLLIFLFLNINNNGNEKNSLISYSITQQTCKYKFRFLHK